MAKTLAARLEEVQDAITKVLPPHNQSVSYNGRSYTKANLDVLYAQEKYLEDKIASGERGIHRTLAEF